MREAIIYVDDEELYHGVNFGYLLAPALSAVTSKEKRFANVLCVGIRKLINDDYIAHFPHLKYILSPSTGLDHIQITNKDIEIINLNPADVDRINASSEFAFLLILAALKRFPSSPPDITSPPA